MKRSDDKITEKTRFAKKRMKTFEEGMRRTDADPLLIRGHVFATDRVSFAAF